MTTTKEAIAEALNGMDHADATLWTDDGAPKLDVVSKLVNDDKLTRLQVNDALPGFMRDTLNAGKPKDKNTTIIGDGLGQIKPGSPAALALAAQPVEKFDADQTREVLAKRVRVANEQLAEQRRQTSESRMAEVKCEQRLARAIADQQRLFPPLSAAENIKQHLASQQKALAERVEGTNGPSTRNALDETMSRRNKRGQTRPNYVAARVAV